MKKLSLTRACCVLLVSILSVTSYAQRNELGDAFTNNGFGNAIGYSPGVHYKDVTYVSYQGPKEHPWVASYNHTTRTWAGPYRAGASILGEGDVNRIDNHGRPSLVVDKEGYIHVFYGGHGGDTDLHGENPLGDTHSGEMRHRVSKNPYDISSWRTLDNISSFGTYAQAAAMDNGDIYFFYRHGAHQSDWVYQLSTDNGLTFGAPVSILKSEKVPSNPNVRRHTWYMSITKTAGDRIDLAFNYHPENRPHNLERRNGYYMYMNTETREFKNVKNELLRMPIRKGYADRNTLVVKTDANKWASGPKVVLDRDGSPHFMLQEGRDDGTKSGGPKTQKYYRWDKNTQKWLTQLDPRLPGGSATTQVVWPRKASLLIATRDNGRGTVTRWSTTNGGKKFNKGDVVFDGGGGGVTISDPIVDAHPTATHAILDRRGGTNYVDLILWGRNGAIQRKRSDASLLNRAQRAEEPF